MYFTQEDYKKIENWLHRNSVKDTEFQEALPFTGKEIVTVVQDGHNRKVNIQEFINQLYKHGVEGFLNVTNTYRANNITLKEAIRLIPAEARKEGQVITFLNTDGNWEIYQFIGKLNQWNNPTLWNNPFDWEKFVVDSILPDEEDLTKSEVDKNGNSFLSLKDREYNPTEFSGLGRVILRKNLVEFEDGKGGKIIKNYLSQKDFSKENTIYEIRYDFDLNNQTIYIPTGCQFDYVGGSLSNGKVVYNNTLISGNEIIKSITREGNYNYLNSIADNEDLISVDGKLSLKDRSALNGMGYVILRKNKTFAEQVNKPNTIYEIRYDYDLDGGIITLPTGCFFDFRGGSVFNGKLNGRLENECFDVTNFGVKYGAGYGVHNASNLQVISGITSPLSLEIAGELWLSGAEIHLSTSCFSLKSDKSHTIHLDKFEGFEAKSIISSGLNVASINSTLFKIPSFVGAASFKMEDCICSGDVRVLTSQQKATSAEHLISSFIVKNCIFEDIHCWSGSNAIFVLSDTIVNHSEISNNVIHNSTSIIFHFGITNDSEYVPRIAASERNLIATANLYYNDLAYKPWLNPNIPTAGAYICMLLFESGNCVVKNNVFRNILWEEVDRVAVYDNYLSADNLIYENNEWENCGNLSGYLTVLMKSKGGIRRVYKNNRYLMTDLSSEIGTTDKRGTTSPNLFQTESIFEFVCIEGNDITMSGIYCNSYNIYSIKNFIFKDNKMRLASFKKTQYPVLFAVCDLISKWDIVGNDIELTGESTGVLGLVGLYTPMSGGCITISDNRLVGFTSIIYNTSQCKYDGRIVACGNVLELGNTIGSVNAYMVYGLATELVFNNNVFKNLNPSSTFYITFGADSIEWGASALIANMPVYAFKPADRFVADKIYNCIVEVNGMVCELNMSYVNGVANYFCYSEKGVLQNNPTAPFNVFCYGGDGEQVRGRMISSGLQITTLVKANNFNEMKVTIREISDITHLSLYPNAVVTADRPILSSNDVGKSVHDKTLGKPIWWTGTKWIDATGADV